MTGPNEKVQAKKENPSVPFLYLNISDKYELITNKAIETMQFIYNFNFQRF